MSTKKKAPDEVVDESAPAVASTLLTRFEELQQELEHVAKRVSSVEDSRKELEQMSKRVSYVEDTMLPLSRSDTNLTTGTSSRSVNKSLSFKDTEQDDSRRKTTGFRSPRTLRSSVKSDGTKSDGFRSMVSFKRDNSPKISMGSSVNESEEWDGSEASQPLLTDSTINENYRTWAAGKRGARRRTVFNQKQHAKDVVMPVKILGVAVAFVTIIFIWETADLAMLLVSPRKEVRLIGYMLLAAMAAVALTLSHEWIHPSEDSWHMEIAHTTSSLVPSFAYALSTLFLAIGTWGVVKTAVDIVVPLKMQVFCYASGAVVGLVCTVAYSYQTKHNVLLDIASCATTMGLDEEGSEDEKGDTSFATCYA